MRESSDNSNLIGPPDSDAKGVRVVTIIIYDWQYGFQGNSGLHEQVLPQASGFAMVQLKAILKDDDDYDEEEDLTSKERLARRMDKWS